MINEAEAKTVRTVFRLYLEHGNVRRVKGEVDRMCLKTKVRKTVDGQLRGGRPLSRGYIYTLLNNPLYIGRIAHKGAVYEGRHEAVIGPETWDAVQAKLASNIHERRTGTRAAEPSLLAGLLYDERGNRLSPSHAIKSGKRYRYYVSQALLQHRDGEAGMIVRIPATEIEEHVCARIMALLEDPTRLIDELINSGDSPRDQRRLLAAAGEQVRTWPRLSPSLRRCFLQTAVERVSAGDKRVEIILSRCRLKGALLKQDGSTTITAIDHDGPDALILHVDAKLKLCSGEMRLVLQAGTQNRLTPRPNAALIKALTRAYTWKEMLICGQAPSIRAIAQEENLAERYVSRILRLAFLAPDIMEAILGGMHPADLELDRLLQGIPLAWMEQRQVFGFVAGAEPPPQSQI